MNVGIIGGGKIANHLQQRLEADGHVVAFLLRREVFSEFGQTYERKGSSVADVLARTQSTTPVSAVFLAIATLDKGEAACEYIHDCVSIGVPVITCEKGAGAYHAEKLKMHSDSGLLRNNAAVTGGVQSLGYLRSRHIAHRRAEVQAVVNGTCNYIFSEVASGGRTLGEACQEAISLGYAEPGASNPLSLINGELRDVVMKTCIIFNMALAVNRFITPTDFGSFQLTQEQLEELGMKASHHRLVVSFSNNPVNRLLAFFDGHVSTMADAWKIQIGFRDLNADTSLLPWLPRGVSNAIQITEGSLGAGGEYLLSGPGAGAEATTTAMLNDFLDLK